MNFPDRVSEGGTSSKTQGDSESEFESDVELGLRWLVNLRWGAGLSQLLALVFVHFGLGLELPYLPLLGLVLFTLLSNSALSFLLRPKHGVWEVPLILLTDVLLLTLMLAWSGGPSNPFTVFFLVHVALGAVLLEPRWSWGLVATTAVAFGALFVLPIGGHEHHHHHGALANHLVGMWVAYVLAAGFVAYFVGRLSHATRERDRKLSVLAGLKAQNERLATLSAFSASAAHELGSPLATIGLSADELVRAVGTDEDFRSVADDARLIHREAMRCRKILAELSTRAGASVGEMPSTSSPGEITRELVASLPSQLGSNLRIRFASEAAERSELFVPSRTLVQMLVNLVKNAFEAQDESGTFDPVELEVDVDERVIFTVYDRGSGMAKEIADTLGEPFVTTKSQVGGLGLGIYLVRAFAERTGGKLRLGARDGGGVVAELTIFKNVMRSGS